MTLLLAHGPNSLCRSHSARAIPQDARSARFLEQRGAVSGIQLAHAGRKAATARPWEGGGPLTNEAGGWEVVVASPIPFSEQHRVPAQLSPEAMGLVRKEFEAAAVRAKEAGFRYLELHAAHGYLLHSFLSPLSNQRSDAYGGSFENRIRFLLEVVGGVRRLWPEEHVLAVRLSCTDWVEGGWTIDDTVQLTQRLATEGVDLIDCSAGGSTPNAHIPVGPGYQVPFAEAVRRASGLRVAAVGMITEAIQANAIITEDRADLVFLARHFLRDPYFGYNAARALGYKGLKPPEQYGRAF